MVLSFNTMKIQIPFQRAGACLNNSNLKHWESLNCGEKLFYKYVLECDTTLSSVLLGIFIAYVVNLISSLVTLKVTGLFMLAAYVFNMIWAFKVLFILVKLYRVHVLLEKQKRENAISIRVNSDFKFLHEMQAYIAGNVKLLKKSAIGLFISLLLCFSITNGLVDVMHIVFEYAKSIWKEMVKWIS